MNYIPGITAIIFVVISTAYISVSHASWETGEFYFTQKTIISIPQGQMLKPGALYTSVEDRQQLCYYAKIRAELLYIDYNHVPEWQKYEDDIEDENSMHYGMYCATLPTTFLLVRSYKPFIQITFLESKVTDYVFDKSVLDVHSVRPNEGNSVTPFAQLSVEDRRNLCVTAREHIHMVFMDHNVEKGKVYEFSYGNTSESHFAFFCPATPQVYIICPDPSVKTVKLIRHRRPVDLYEFEIDELKASLVTPEPEGNHSSVASPENTLTQLDANDRLIVCTAARKFASLPSRDADVAAASWYTFQYPNLPKQIELSLLCPAVPTVYMRADNLSAKAKIKLTFHRNPFDEYRYETALYWEIWERFPERDNDKEAFTSMINEFPLTALNEEERWQICSTAVARSVEFIVSLIPAHIMPKKVKFAQLSDYKGEFTPSIEVALRCSLRPEMYLRLNKLDEKKITIAFIREQYDTLSNPNMKFPRVGDRLKSNL